jgi:copper chaperone CopZ
MKQTNLEISGMKCEGCAKGVTSALEGVAGVQRAEVSLEEARAEVTADATVTPDALVAAVEDQGFGATPED